MKLKIVENFRAVFYTPFYLLKALRFAEEEGVEVEWIDANVPGGAIELLKRGEADLSWGGPMRIMKDHDSEPGSERSLLGFCQVVGKDPFSLVSRKECASMSLAGLHALRLAVTKEVPTPWLCLQADLEEAGVDVESLRASVTQDMTQEEQLQALRSRAIDVAQVFEPFVSQALEDDAYGVLYDAADRGPTLYTTFIATRAGVQRHAEAFCALSRAMARTQAWMQCNTEAISETCEPYFPGLAPALLRAATARYLRAGIWSAGPAVDEAGFNRLSHSLHQGGFIAQPGNFARCIWIPGHSSRDRIAARSVR